MNHTEAAQRLLIKLYRVSTAGVLVSRYLSSPKPRLGWTGVDPATFLPLLDILIPPKGNKQHGNFEKDKVPERINIPKRKKTQIYHQLKPKHPL